MRASRTTRVLWLAGLPIAALGAARVFARRFSLTTAFAGHLTISAVGRNVRYADPDDPISAVTLVAVMGGVQVDLSQASIDPAGLLIDATAVMGGVQIRLPPGTRVAVNHIGVAGSSRAVTDVHEAPGETDVVVRATAVMGGVLVTDRSR